MVETTGRGLHIVVAAETAQDWAAFGCWYSARKSLPDARITVVVSRTTRVQVHYFQWLKRLGVAHRFQNPTFRDRDTHRLQVASAAWSVPPEATLVVSPYVAFTAPWNGVLCALASGVQGAYVSDRYCLLTGVQSQPEIASAIDRLVLGAGGPGVDADLCLEARSTPDPWPFVGYLDGCGRWTAEMTHCPFSHASGLTLPDMTVNEWRVIEFWRRMVPVYSVAQ